MPITPGTPVPPRVGAKGWQSLFRTRLNIVWIPSDQLFLRVLQLPASDITELVSMLEFQIERISPLPVHQIVWSVEVLPSNLPNTQTAVVVIVPRDVIEGFLGRLEEAGYVPDRIEFPYLHQLVIPPQEQDGVWLYPLQEGGKRLCLAAWWFMGSLQHLQLIHLTGENWQSLLQDQLSETSWAGEVEGWLTTPFRWHVIAPPEENAEWEGLIRQRSEAPIAASQPKLTPQLAEVSAARSARGESHANLLPTEHAARYHQQFVDRLWMRGLAGVFLIYVFGVLAYFGALQYLKIKNSSLQTQVAGLAQSYTNTLQLKERIQVMEDQKILKFAALDCFRAAAEQLPEGMTLSSFQFGRGSETPTVTLRGSAPSDEPGKVNDYNDALRNLTVNGEPLFRRVTPPTSTIRGGVAGSQSIEWSFSAEMAVLER